MLQASVTLRCSEFSGFRIKDDTFQMNSPIAVKGFEIFKGFLGRASCEALVEDLRAVVKDAPLRQPVTPSGKPMSVRMSAAGRLGWVTDRRGYRYAPQQPSGAWGRGVPDRVWDIWREVSGVERLPDSCLINHYGEGARMGMHQDKDEGAFDWPVVSVSLGDDGLFRMGNVARGGKTESIWLQSGDVVVMGGAARLAHHGVDRIRFGSSALLTGGGRLNLTLRVVV